MTFPVCRRARLLPRILSKSWLVVCLVPLIGCQQKMGQQPSYRPLEPSPFFPDNRSSRPLVPGTVAQGTLSDESSLGTGKSGGSEPAALAGGLVGFGTMNVLGTGLTLGPIVEKTTLASYLTTFPFPVTQEMLHRGQERFGIYCVVCHDATGNGNGIIVQRGYTRPPSYIKDASRGLALRGFKVQLRDAPNGYYFEVISRGFGAMADYSGQVAPRDRWAIIAYIRALQLSQYAPLSELPSEEQRAVQKALEVAR